MATEPRVLDFEEYAAQRGASRLDIGDVALHRSSEHVGRRARRQQLDHQLAKDRALIERRQQLRADYDAEVAAGRIRPSTSLERLERAAAGLEDNEATMAARRLLAKRRRTPDRHPHQTTDPPRNDAGNT